MKTVKYLAYYAPDQYESRRFALSARDKIDYICNVLNEAGYRVNIISASTTSEKKCYHGSTVSISENIFLKLFFTFPWGNVVEKLLSVISINLFVFFELLKIERDETLIVYHALSYMTAVKIAYFLKRFRLILEVEEIYSDVSGKGWKRKQEIRYFNVADGYIFPTIILNNLVNTHNKPAVVVHGIYKSGKDVTIDSNDCFRNKDNKIHCVYAGTFEKAKGGAIAAVSATKYLPSNYYVHILGFGNKKDTEELKTLILKVNSSAEATVTFDGLLSGSEYISFLQKCDIGLSTQNPSGAFNDTSFPSKILSYMANGLRVVCIKIPVVETSAISNDLYFYNNQDPKDIANAILKVDVNKPYDSRHKLIELSNEFRESIKNIIGD